MSCYENLRKNIEKLDSMIKNENDDKRLNNLKRLRFEQNKLLLIVSTYVDAYGRKV